LKLASAIIHEAWHYKVVMKRAATVFCLAFLVTGCNNVVRAPGSVDRVDAYATAPPPPSSPPVEILGYAAEVRS